MKKILALALAAAMTCMAALSGCGLEKGNKSESPATNAESSSATKTEGLKVGFIYIGTIGDAGYSYAHDLGRKAIEEKLGSKGVTTIKVESVPETAEAEKAMRNLIDQGCKAIFATSFNYMDYVEKVAKEYPEVKFFHCSGNKSNTTNGDKRPK